MNTFYFSYDKLGCSDVLWYVREEYRKIGVGLGFIGQLFEEWARGKWCEGSLPESDSGIHMDKLMRMMGNEWAWL